MWSRLLGGVAVGKCVGQRIGQAAKGGFSSFRLFSSATIGQYEGYGVPRMLGTGPLHGTTILCIRKNEKVCLAGDGMVSQGSMIVKPNARKIRRIGTSAVLGFAGTTADCFTLVERLEGKLEEFPGQLLRACVELAKQWRTDRYLRHLEAVLIVADDKVSLEVTGNGDVLESHDGILGVGSGGPYAVAAARALYDIPELCAKDIALRSMKIAADMCCHTNHNVIVEVIESGSAVTTPGVPAKNEESDEASTGGKENNELNGGEVSPTREE